MQMIIMVNELFYMTILSIDSVHYELVSSGLQKHAAWFNSFTTSTDECVTNEISRVTKMEMKV